jgi:hypothetical protein
LPRTFADAIEALHGLLGASAVFGRLGYATCIRELSEKTPHLPAICRFELRPHENRRLVIDFCRSARGDHWFTVEVFNVSAADSFLLDEWLGRLGISLSEVNRAASTADRGRLAQRRYAGYHFREGVVR